MRGFLPSTGRLIVFRPPAQTLVAGAPQAAGDAGVRVDTGVYEGGEIAIHYDSMICKLIACGADRAAAIATMREALNGFVVRGVSSNLAFQAALLGHPRFAAGDFNTGFIAEEFAQGSIRPRSQHRDREFLLALAAAFERRLLARSAGLTGQLPGPRAASSARSSSSSSCERRQARETPVVIEVDGANYRVTIGGGRGSISFASPLADVAVQGLVDGAPFRAQIERVGLAPACRRTHGARVEAAC